MPSDALAELDGRPETDRRVGERGGVPPLPERDSVDAALLERDSVVEEGPPLLAERERVEGPRPVEEDPARLIVSSAERCEEGRGRGYSTWRREGVSQSAQLALAFHLLGK